jgi:hypothetical protein
MIMKEDRPIHNIKLFHILMHLIPLMVLLPCLRTSEILDKCQPQPWLLVRSPLVVKLKERGQAKAAVSMPKG